MVGWSICQSVDQRVNDFRPLHSNRSRNRLPDILIRIGQVVQHQRKQFLGSRRGIHQRQGSREPVPPIVVCEELAEQAVGMIRRLAYPGTDQRISQVGALEQVDGADNLFQATVIRRPAQQTVEPSEQFRVAQQLQDGFRLLVGVLVVIGTFSQDTFTKLFQDLALGIGRLQIHTVGDKPLGNLGAALTVFVEHLQQRRPAIRVRHVRVGPTKQKSTEHVVVTA